MRPRGLVLTAGLIAAAGCAGEVTGVSTVPAYVTWMEWPTAVTAARPGSLRLSGYTQCPYRLVFSVSVSGTDIRVSAAGRDPPSDAWCMDYRIGGSDAGGSGAGGGAGYDTLLTLPQLTAPASGLPAWFNISAPMIGPGSWIGSDEVVGHIYLQATADTATQFAGRAFVTGDSSGCWRMRPISQYPYAQWVFAKPLSLEPRSNGYSGFVTGQFVRVNPPICGDSIAVRATRVEVDVTPWGASHTPPR